MVLHRSWKEAAEAVRTAARVASQDVEGDAHISHFADLTSYQRMNAAFAAVKAQLTAVRVGVGLNRHLW